MIRSTLKKLEDVPAERNAANTKNLRLAHVTWLMQNNYSECRFYMVADISVPGTGIAHRIYMYQVQK